MRHETFERARPPLNCRRAAIAALFGVLLFCGAGLILRFQGMLVLTVYIFTPLFGLPLAVELWRQRQIRWLGAIYFVLGLALCHFAAVWIADVLYRPGIDFVFPCHTLLNAELTAADRACLAAQDARRAAQALPAGLAGGAVGAVTSFLGLMLVARRFHTPRRLTTMVGASVVLAAIGGIGFSLAYPDKMSAAQWVLQLFLPWQVVFGATLVLLFDDRAMGDRAT